MMPTPTGLPKPGETWRRTFRLPPDFRNQTITVQVIERGRGDYCDTDIELSDQSKQKPQLWVDASYWFSQGELTHVQT